jgi:hypothetical protein
VPVKDVPSSVKSLLLATKQLQDALRFWSLEKASESDVSDCYVKIGNEFNATIAAFGQLDIDLRLVEYLARLNPSRSGTIVLMHFGSEIYSVPKDLREVLEVCLGEDPSPDVLQRYMPEVRRILYQLYQALQKKQAAYGTASAGRGTPPSYMDLHR